MEAIDFRAAYFRLYGEMATAIEDMQAGEHEKALSRLLLAQLNAEEQFVKHKRPVGITFPKHKKASNKKATVDHKR